jgi:hypothetical protein
MWRSIARGAVVAASIFSAGSALASQNAQYGDDFRQMDVKSCSTKAIDALSEQKFIEGNNDGQVVWGFDEQSVVLVRCVPYNNGVWIEVLAASRSPAEAERLRNIIRIRVFDARRTPRDMLAVTRFNGDGLNRVKRPRTQPAAHWGYDHRPKSLAACTDDAKAAMQKSGLAISTSGNSVVWGQSGSALALVKCLSIPSGVDILVFATSDVSATAETYRNNIRILTFK